MRRITALLAVCAILLCLTGCQERSRLTGKDFKNAMTEQGYHVSEAHGEECLPGCRRHYRAEDTDSMVIELYQMDSIRDAKALYASQVDGLRTDYSKDTGAVFMEAVSPEGGRYRVEAQNQQITLWLEKDALLRIDAPADAQKMVRSILLTMGY